MPLTKYYQTWANLRIEERKALGLMNHGMYKAAVPHLHKILLLNPKYADAYYLLSII